MSKLHEIAKRAALIKSNPKLRHIPNKHDLNVASEHAQIMIYPQHQAIKDDKLKEKFK